MFRGVKRPSSGGNTLPVFVACLLRCAQLTPKTASVVRPEDGHLTPEARRGLQHNKVIVKVKVY
jgi:hypothetical protein